MAGDWIKMRVALTYDLKVMQIARFLNGDDGFLDQLAPGCQIGRGQCNVQALHTFVIGALHRFWSAAQEITADGKLGTLDSNDIDCLVGCYGFTASLLEIGWLEALPDGSLQVHNWFEHNGESAKKRAMAGKRVQKHRDVKRSSVTTPREDVTQTALPEKRREEKSIKTPPLPPKGEGDARFDQFWSAYPKKVGKGAARKTWDKLRPSAELLAAILAAVERQRQCEQWRREDGRFIPNPATWLGQSRWEDECTPAAPAEAPEERARRAEALRRQCKVENALAPEQVRTVLSGVLRRGQS